MGAGQREVAVRLDLPDEVVHLQATKRPRARQGDTRLVSGLGLP